LESGTPATRGDGAVQLPWEKKEIKTKESDFWFHLFLLEARCGEEGLIWWPKAFAAQDHITSREEKGFGG